MIFITASEITELERREALAEKISELRVQLLTEEFGDEEAATALLCAEKELYRGGVATVLCYGQSPKIQARRQAEVLKAEGCTI